MDNPKYQTGQEVEVPYNHYVGHENAVIKGARWVYKVEFTKFPGHTYDRDEDQIRERRPSPEEAWEKAAMLIGKRAEGWGNAWIAREEWDKETRHQVYQILGAASIKITDEVKRDVHRLIEVADKM